MGRMRRTTGRNQGVKQSLFIHLEALVMIIMMAGIIRLVSGNWPGTADLALMVGTLALIGTVRLEKK